MALSRSSQSVSLWFPGPDRRSATTAMRGRPTPRIRHRAPAGRRHSRPQAPAEAATLSPGNVRRRTESRAFPAARAIPRQTELGGGVPPAPSDRQPLLKTTWYNRRVNVCPMVLSSGSGYRSGPCPPVVCRRPAGLGVPVPTIPRVGTRGYCMSPPCGGSGLGCAIFHGLAPVATVCRRPAGARCSCVNHTTGWHPWLLDVAALRGLGTGVCDIPRVGTRGYCMSPPCGGLGHPRLD
jgi:hypothetical protein